MLVQHTNKNSVKISGKINLRGKSPMDQFSQEGILSQDLDLLTYIFITLSVKNWLKFLLCFLQARIQVFRSYRSNSVESLARDQNFPKLCLEPFTLNFANVININLPLKPNNVPLTVWLMPLVAWNWVQGHTQYICQGSLVLLCPSIPMTHSHQHLIYS